DMEALIHVDVLEPPALGNGILLDGEVILSYASGGSKEQCLCPYFCAAPHRDSGGDEGQICGVVRDDAVQVLFISVSGGAPAHDGHLQGIGADGLKLLSHVGLHAVAQTDDDHDGGDADNNAQHSEEGAHFTGEDIL